MPNKRQIQRDKVATYASVLFDSAYEAGGKDLVLEIRDQAEQILRAERTNMTLSDVLRGTDYNGEEKAQIARAAFAEADPMLVSFLAVMAERGDFRLLLRVWKYYGELIEKRLNVTVVDVTTVVELDDRLREAIIKMEEADLGTDVVLHEHIDKSILGGIILVANERRIDASVLARLEEARLALKQNNNGGEASD